MVRMLITILVCQFLGGCAAMCHKFYPTEPEIVTVTKTVEVKVPVSDVPEPPVRTLPVLPVQNLKKGDTPDEVYKAYAASIQILKDEVILRDNDLKTYRRPTNGQVTP